MKYLSSLALVVAVTLSSTFGAAHASEPTNAQGTFEWVPPQCAAVATKDAHPTWYRFGGYCRPLDFNSHSN